MTCLSPRDETVPMRQEGSGDVCAMTEWLQSNNPLPVQGILEGPGQAPKFKECVRDGGHFACVAWQIHWGAQADVRWHKDYESTPMHVGVVVEGERTIHVRDHPDSHGPREYDFPQEREGVYVLATPYHFDHGGSFFAARTHKNPVVLMQFRWLLRHDLPATRRPASGEAIPLGGSDIRSFRTGPAIEEEPEQSEVGSDDDDAEVPPRSRAGGACETA